MIDYKYGDKEQNNSASKKMLISIEGSDTTIENNRIYQDGFELYESICSTDQLRFGSCESSVVKLKIRNEFGDLSGKWLNISKVFNQDIENAFVIGRYKVYSCEKSGDRQYVNITAYDQMYDIINADVVAWYDALEFPIALKAFRDSFFKHVNVAQREAHLIQDEIIVEKTIDADSLSGLDVISAICELNGVFGHIDRNGDFIYVSLTQEKEPVKTYNKYSSCEYEDFESNAITKVQIRGEEGDVGAVFGTGDNAYIVSDNFLTYGKNPDELMGICKRLYEKIENISYVPFKASVASDFRMEVGDFIEIPTKTKNIQSYILERTINGILSARESLETKGVAEYEEKVNSSNKEVAKLKGKLNKLTRTVEETVSELVDLEKNVDTKITQTAEEIKLEASKTYATQQSVDEELGRLQDQIDGAIETFSGKEVPTLTNEPAASWDTDEEKDTHVGDLYIVSADGGGFAGFYYRFEKTRGEYQWTLLKDTEVTKALADAKVANEKAEEAKKLADEVSANAEKLGERVASVESSIEQTAENIKFLVKKEELSEVLENYSTKEDTSSSIDMKADEILSTVSQTYTEKKSSVKEVHMYYLQSSGGTKIVDKLTFDGVLDGKYYVDLNLSMDQLDNIRLVWVSGTKLSFSDFQNGATIYYNDGSKYDVNPSEHVGDLGDGALLIGEITVVYVPANNYTMGEYNFAKQGIYFLCSDQVYVSGFTISGFAGFETKTNKPEKPTEYPPQGDGGGCLEWDGNTDGLTPLDEVLYKVTDTCPTLEELSGGGTVYVVSDGENVSFAFPDEEEGIVVDYDEIGIATFAGGVCWVFDDVEIEGELIAKGTYFLAYENSGHYTYVSKLSLNNFSYSEGWTEIEPAYKSGKNIYTTICTVYNDGTFSYSDVSESGAESAIESIKNEAVEESKSYIKQTAEEINLVVEKKVGYDEIISSINQSAEEILISASKIELEGAVTISALDQETKDLITNASKDALDAAESASQAQKDAETAANAAGNAVKSITMHYLASKLPSGVTTDTSGWTTDPQDITEEKRYLWTYQTLTLMSGVTTDSSPVISGVYGNKGEQGESGERGAPGTDGRTTYFHIKYSAVSNPTSASQLTETPSEYIGTYVDYIELDSTEPSKYTWAKFQGSQGEKGDQGIPGKNGEDGKTSYLHIAYANSADGKTGFDVSDSVNKLYIGQYTDFTQSDSMDPAQYSWTKIKGADGTNGTNGVGVKSVTNYYLATNSASGVTISTSGWTSTVQSVSISKKYLWNYEVVTFTNGSTSSTDPCIIGAYGDKGADGTSGADGKGISEITEYYQVSGSNTTAPTSWSKEVPNMTTENRYLWNYEVIKYTDNTIAETAKRVIGVYGNTGATGAAGKGILSVTEYYQVSASNSTAPTSWVTSVPTMTTSNKYLWNYEVITYTDGSKEPTSKRVIGAYGNTGESGSNGKDGSDGRSIGSITNYYLATSSSSGVTSATSGWTTTVQTISNSKKYLWNYEVVKYTDGTVASTSTPCIIGTYGDTGATGAQGYSLVTYVARGSFTESNWSTYGEIGHVENWSNTSSIRNGCRVGDLFAVTGTATDTKNSHELVYRCDNSSGDLHGSCIAHTITPRGATGNGVSKVIPLYYLKSNATAPSAPSSAVTSTSTGSGVWTTAVPTYVSGYTYFTCTQTLYTSGSYGWSTVVTDSALTSANAKAYEAYVKASDNDKLISSWCYENNKTYINGNKIYTGTITAQQIASGTITADKINVGDLFAQDITATGSISGMKFISKGKDSGGYDSEMKIDAGELLFTCTEDTKYHFTTQISAHHSNYIYNVDGGAYNTLAFNGNYLQLIHRANGITDAATTVLSASAANNLVTCSNLKVNGETTMSGQLKTSFKSSVAMGSYAATSTTLANFVNEIRFSSGAMGSVNLTTAYTSGSNTITAGWYNYMYSPHRSGGLNGGSNGDNCNYGTLLLFGMTISNANWRIRIAGTGGIAEIARVIDTSYTGQLANSISGNAATATNAQSANRATNDKNGRQIDRIYAPTIPSGTSITANSDLNTEEFLKVGSYYCSANNTVATFDNCPTNVAFMMLVYSPLSTTIDNESTSAWCYRLRKLTTYTGDEYEQLCYTGATAGVWTYGAWKKIVDTADFENHSSQYALTKKAVQKANQSVNFTSSTSMAQIATISIPANCIFFVNVSALYQNSRPKYLRIKNNVSGVWLCDVVAGSSHATGCCVGRTDAATTLGVYAQYESAAANIAYIYCFYIPV